MTYIVGNGEPAQWHIALDASDNGVPDATIDVNMDNGLDVVDLRDLASALLTIADELQRITAR